MTCCLSHYNPYPLYLYQYRMAYQQIQQTFLLLLLNLKPCRYLLLLPKELVHVSADCSLRLVTRLGFGGDITLTLCHRTIQKNISNCVTYSTICRAAATSRPRYHPTLPPKAEILFIPTRTKVLFALGNGIGLAEFKNPKRALTSL
jgi:hypothetical protein